MWVVLCRKSWVSLVPIPLSLQRQGRERHNREADLNIRKTKVLLKLRALCRTSPTGTPIHDTIAGNMPETSGLGLSWIKYLPITGIYRATRFPNHATAAPTSEYPCRLIATSGQSSWGECRSPSLRWNRGKFPCLPRDFLLLVLRMWISLRGNQYFVKVVQRRDYRRRKREIASWGQDGISWLRWSIGWKMHQQLSNRAVRAATGFNEWLVMEGSKSLYDKITLTKNMRVLNRLAMKITRKYMTPSRKKRWIVLVRRSWLSRSGRKIDKKVGTHGVLLDLLIYVRVRQRVRNKMQQSVTKGVTQRAASRKTIV